MSIEEKVSIAEKDRRASAEVAGSQLLTLRYFAWVREKVGRGEETVAVPAHVLSVADLVQWLTTRGPEYGTAFGRAGVVRAAIDQLHVKPSSSIKGAKEIAFFPPVTGG